MRLQVDALLEKVKDHVDDIGLTEEGFRRLYTVNANFNPEEHHKKLETYLKINDNTKAARITVRFIHVFTSMQCPSIMTTPLCIFARLRSPRSHSYRLCVLIYE